MSRCLLPLALLAACAPAMPGSLAQVPVRDDLAARAAAAGLTPEQAERLVAMDVPAVVPADQGAFALVDFQVEPMEVDSRGLTYRLAYRLVYRDNAGTCFAIYDTQEGWGDRPRAGAPRRAVPIPALGITAEVSHLYAETPDDRSELGTDELYFEGTPFALTSSPDQADGCHRVLDPSAGAALIAALRPLDPADDYDPTYRPLSDELLLDAVDWDHVEPLARSTFGRGETTGGIRVEVVRRTPRRVVVLVTSLGLADDSVRDEQTRATFLSHDGGASWSFAGGGLRVRCQPGRGHRGWNPGPCR